MRCTYWKWRLSVTSATLLLPLLLSSSHTRSNNDQQRGARGAGFLREAYQKLKLMLVTVFFGSYNVLMLYLEEQVSDTNEIQYHAIRLMRRYWIARARRG